MRSLRASVIRLAYENPHLRHRLLDIIKKADEETDEAMYLDAGRTWGNPDPRSTPDDNTPYNKHPESPPAGADGSAQRKVYNRWFQENVCPTHKTKCGDPDRFGG